jgi:acetamidase/formamidase
VAHRTIHSAHHHFGWDNALEPVTTCAPGDALELQVLEASGGRITPQSPAADVRNLDPDFANPVTGPVWIDGAEPGDTLEVEVLDFHLSGWGWTALIPGFGLLHDQFPEPYLHHSRHADGVIEFTPEVLLPVRPFPGTIGVAPAEPGRHSAIPPRAVGGNLDVRHLGPGARLLLPVAVPGALFSVGDTHAAQGDGEVCGTAIESPMTVALRFGLHKGGSLRFPRLHLPPAPDPPPLGARVVTTGVGPSLEQAARDAVLEMIDHLGREYGMAPELAYCLCSVAADLQVSELVNLPNVVVSAVLDTGVFR